MVGSATGKRKANVTPPNSNKTRIQPASPLADQLVKLEDEEEDTKATLERQPSPLKAGEGYTPGSPILFYVRLCTIWNSMGGFTDTLGMCTGRKIGQSSPIRNLATVSLTRTTDQADQSPPRHLSRPPTLSSSDPAPLSDPHPSPSRQTFSHQVIPPPRFPPLHPHRLLFRLSDRS